MIFSAATKRRIFAATVVIAVASTVLAAATGGGDEGARLPVRDTVVLDAKSLPSALQRIRTLQQRVLASPGDADTAVLLARTALQEFAVSGDPRLTGIAETTIRAWRDEERPPGDIWLLRARLAQIAHRFEEAASDLESFLTLHPESVEGSLLAADAWRRAGNIGRARELCLQLALGGHSLVAGHCAADILLSLGRAEDALRLVTRFDGQRTEFAAGTAGWATAIAADVAAAAGRQDAALEYYRQAFRAGKPGLPLRLSHADFLLAVGQPREALNALRDTSATDAVLLRRAIAAKRLTLSEEAELVESLRNRFQVQNETGTERLHLREQALFALYVDEDPQTALRLALQNWDIQKGPEDAQLLQEAAVAAGRRRAADVVDVWRQAADTGGV